MEYQATMMVVIAEYNNGIEIFTDVDKIEDRDTEVLLCPGPRANFDRITILPNWQEINLDVDDIESMIREHIKEENRRIRDERMEERRNDQD